MKELICEVRVSRDGEYENTETFYIEIDNDTPEDKEMEAMMTEIRGDMEAEYGDDPDWEEGNISWVLDTWGEW